MVTKIEIEKHTKRRIMDDERGKREYQEEEEREDTRMN